MTRITKEAFDKMLRHTPEWERRLSDIKPQDMGSAPKDGTTILVYAETFDEPGEYTTWLASWRKAQHVPLYGWYAVPQTHDEVELIGLNPVRWMAVPKMTEGEG